MVTWSPGLSLEEMERLCIQAAMVFYRGNKTATASSLGIAVRTLDNRLEKYAADDEARRAASAEAATERQAALARARGEFKRMPVDLTGSPTPPARHAGTDTDAVAAAVADMPAPPPPAAQAPAKAAGAQAAARPDIDDLLKPRRGG